MNVYLCQIRHMPILNFGDKFLCPILNLGASSLFHAQTGSALNSALNHFYA